jgi:hypothetical protein
MISKSARTKLLISVVIRTWMAYDLARRQNVNHARPADINLNTLDLSLPLVGKFRDKPLCLQLFGRGEPLRAFVFTYPFSSSNLLKFIS